LPTTTRQGVYGRRATDRWRRQIHLCCRHQDHPRRILVHPAQLGRVWPRRRSALWRQRQAPLQVLRRQVHVQGIQAQDRALEGSGRGSKERKGQDLLRPGLERPAKGRPRETGQGPPGSVPRARDRQGRRLRHQLEAPRPHLHFGPSDARRRPRGCHIPPRSPLPLRL